MAEPTEPKEPKEKKLTDGELAWLELCESQGLDPVTGGGSGRVTVAGDRRTVAGTHAQRRPSFPW